MIISFFHFLKYRKNGKRVLVLYFPILMLKKAKDLDFYSPFINNENREENLFIKKGEVARFLFPIF